MAIVVGHSSGQCVYPKKTRVSRLRVLSAKENGCPSVSMSSVVGAWYGSCSTAPVNVSAELFAHPANATPSNGPSTRPSTSVSTGKGVLRTAHPLGEVVGQGRERGQRSGRVVVVEQAANERRAHDHPVGVRRDLGRLVPVADPEPDRDRQVRPHGRSAFARATSGSASSLVEARAPVTPITAVA